MGRLILFVDTDTGDAADSVRVAIIPPALPPLLKAVFFCDLETVTLLDPEEDADDEGDDDAEEEADDSTLQCKTSSIILPRSGRTF